MSVKFVENVLLLFLIKGRSLLLPSISSTFRLRYSLRSVFGPNAFHDLEVIFLGIISIFLEIISETKQKKWLCLG